MHNWIIFLFHGIWGSELSLSVLHNGLFTQSSANIFVRNNIKTIQNTKWTTHNLLWSAGLTDTYPSIMRSIKFSGYLLYPLSISKIFSLSVIETLLRTFHVPHHEKLTTVSLSLSLNLSLIHVNRSTCGYSCRHGLLSVMSLSFNCVPAYIEVSLF